MRERGVLGQVARQVHRLVRAPLRRHHRALHLAHLRVVGRRRAVQVARDLGGTDRLILRYVHV